MEPTSLRFARTARQLAETSRRLGLTAPSFRSPPRLTEVDRSIRRSGSRATVAVQLRNRPWNAIVADMIEGIVVANEIQPGQANRFRSQLWEAVEAPELQVA